MIRPIPIEEGPLSLFNAQGDAAVWHDGVAWVRLAEDRTRVFMIDRDPPTSLSEAVDMARMWRNTEGLRGGDSD